MILASIILYNPEIELLKKNIDAIYKQVDKLILIDNNSFNKQNIKELVKRLNKIEIIENDKNNGIAEALNQSLEYGNTKGYNWLLTLDQDSVCEIDMIEKYKKYLHSLPSGNGNILLLCPSIKDVNLKSEIREEVEPKEVAAAITSGSLINIKNGMNIGGFESQLFIDYVDFEFCLRGRLEGLKIIKLSNVHLLHRLGEIKEINLFGLKIIVTNHSPLRRYYLFRNKIYIYKKYWGVYNSWIIRNIFSSLKVIIIVILFEKEKLKQMKQIFNGVKDGFVLNNIRT